MLYEYCCQVLGTGNDGQRWLILTRAVEGSQIRDRFSVLVIINIIVNRSKYTISGSITEMR